MYRGGVADEVVMPLAGKHDEFRVRDFAPEDVGALVVREIAGCMMLVVTDEHQGRNPDLIQTGARVVLLPGNDMTEVARQRRDARHPDFKKLIDDISMLGKERGRKARFDGVLADVSLEAFFDHPLAKFQRQSFGFRE